MSESKTDKSKCTLSDAELIEKSNDWVSKLAKTGGEAWPLRIPVDFNHDPDMLFIELGNRLKNASTENLQLRTALSLFIGFFDLLNLKDAKVSPEGVLGDFFETLDEAINKARQLLITDEP